MENAKKLPSFRVGRRILFTDERYGPSLGIITCANIPWPEKRGYVAICKPAHLYTTDDQDAICADNDDLPYAVMCDQIDPETVLAMWEEPAIMAAAFQFNSFGDLLYRQKPMPKKMTVAEICEALGYVVEIIREEHDA